MRVLMPAFWHPGGPGLQRGGNGAGSAAAHRRRSSPSPTIEVP
jgi:hypothetical protein